MQNISSNLNEQIARIKTKFSRLKKKDRNFQISGADHHKYKLDPVLKNETVASFEKTYQVKLPTEYALFLQQIGNGGAGPFYGLDSLQKSFYQGLDFTNEDSKTNFALPFPYQEAWNMSFENQEFDEKVEEEYFSSEHSTGLLSICGSGCGFSENLVITGQEYGNVWTDGRCSDAGIFPSELGNKERLNFLDWYELWLDKSLKELNV